MTDTFVIAGAGFAGAKAAETLREEGFDGRIVLIGAEHDRPYERPPLSKDYLRGDAERETIYVHPEGFYAEHDVELRLGRRAVELDLGRRELVLDDGEWLRYDRLLLATGAEPRRLAIPGSELDGVLYLRSVDRLRRAARAARPRRLARRRRRRMDRLRGRRVRPHAGSGRHRARPAGGPARARARPRGGRRLPRHPSRPRRADAARDRRRGLRGRGPRRARPHERRRRDRLRLRRRRRGRAPAHRAGRAGRDRRRRRDPRRRAARDQRRPACSRPATSPTPSIRSTASGSASSTGPTRSSRARPRRATCSVARWPYDSPAVLLLRPVRHRHGVRRLRAGRGTASSSAAIPRRREFIAFWLTGDRVVAGMNFNVWDVTDDDPAAHPQPHRGRRRAARRSRRAARDARPRSGRQSGMNRLQALHDAGVSIWLDTLSRELLDSGDFAALIADSAVTGATSNPTIFAKAITTLRSLRRRSFAPRPGTAPRRSCSSRSRSTTSAAPPTCCVPSTRPAAGATASCRSSARPTSPTTRRPRSSRRSTSGVASRGPT